MSDQNPTSADAAEQNMLAAIAIRDKLEACSKEIEPTLKAQRPSLEGVKWEKWNEISFPLNPENPLMNWTQTHLHTSLRLGGYPGLVQVLWEQHWNSKMIFLTRPGTTVTESARHRYIMDDCKDNDGKGIAVLLGCMHNEILPSLIKGEITSRSYEEQDGEFKKILEGYAYLTVSPCIYINEIVNRKMIDDKVQAYPGRCLNWHEWRETLDKLDQYHIEARITPQTSWVEKVHRQFPSSATPPGNIDRYLKTEKAFQTLREFIDSNRRSFVTPGIAIWQNNPADARLSIPFRRVPREIGWAKDGVARAVQHIAQAQSNSLYGLFQAVLWALFGNDRFEIKQYELLPVPEASYAQLAESLCSQIGFTYWNLGAAGLNPEFAGTIPVARITAPEFQHKFDEVKRRLKQSNMMAENTAAQIEQNFQIKAALRANTTLPGSTWDQWDLVERDQERTKSELDKITEQADELVIRCGIAELDEWEKEFGS